MPPPDWSGCCAERGAKKLSECARERAPSDRAPDWSTDCAPDSPPLESAIHADQRSLDCCAPPPPPAPEAVGDRPGAARKRGAARPKSFAARSGSIWGGGLTGRRLMHVQVRRLRSFTTRRPRRRKGPTRRPRRVRRISRSPSACTCCGRESASSPEATCAQRRPVTLTMCLRSSASSRSEIMPASSVPETPKSCSKPLDGTHSISPLFWKRVREMAEGAYHSWRKSGRGSGHTGSERSTSCVAACTSSRVKPISQAVIMALAIASIDLARWLM
mmetsp:Transcript_2225/g.6450  ORF Transcript_2225/g.6450 Transcript_2225/m.6450 type:complete len:274 (+) Transcript_2225:447-1268(+)